MALSSGATKELVAGYISGLGNYIAAFTSSSVEASGGSYARQQTTWSAGTAGDGIYSGSEVRVNVPAGTYTHFGIFSAESGGTAVEVKAFVAEQIFSGPGELLITPTITVS